MRGRETPFRLIPVATPGRWTCGRWIPGRPGATIRQSLGDNRAMREAFASAQRRESLEAHALRRKGVRK